MQSSEKNCQKQKEEKLRARTAAALEMHEELRPSYCYYRGVLACSAKLLCALGCMCPDGTSVLLSRACTAPHSVLSQFLLLHVKDYLKTVACTM